MRAGTGVGLVLLGFGAALVLGATAAQIAASLDIDLDYVTPGFLGYLAPVTFAAFAFAVGKWMLRGAWTSRRALLSYVWLFGFTVANVINRSPGWCETIGFPFVWRSWSDSMIILEDGRVSTWIAASRPAAGAVLNLFTFAAVAWVLTRAGISGRSA